MSGYFFSNFRLLPVKENFLTRQVFKVKTIIKLTKKTMKIGIFLKYQTGPKLYTPSSDTVLIKGRPP